jgi:H+/Cl- antiporter ClcA
MQNFFFDYIYYRLLQFYFKWDGRNGITAVIGVSMIQCLVLVDVMLWGERFIYSKKQIISDQNAKMVAYLGVAVLFGLIAFNYFKYRNKFNSFRNRWKQESSRSRRLKGFAVLACLILPWIPLVLLGSN